jgi:hypothetical protein
MFSKLLEHKKENILFKDSFLGISPVQQAHVILLYLAYIVFNSLYFLNQELRSIDLHPVIQHYNPNARKHLNETMHSSSSNLLPSNQQPISKNQLGHNLSNNDKLLNESRQNAAFYIQYWYQSLKARRLEYNYKSSILLHRLNYFLLNNDIDESHSLKYRQAKIEKIIFILRQPNATILKKIKSYRRYGFIEYASLSLYLLNLKSGRLFDFNEVCEVI